MPRNGILQFHGRMRLTVAEIAEMLQCRLYDLEFLSITNKGSSDTNFSLTIGISSVGYLNVSFSNKYKLRLHCGFCCISFAFCNGF